MKFRLNSDFMIDTDVETWRSEGLRVGFYSAPGTRKSYTAAACFVEPFLEAGGTVVIFQPKSEWHTLKEKYGSVLVVGGPFQDVPLAVNQAHVYAETIVKQGLSAVFDFCDIDDEDLVKFAAELLARIFTLENVVRRPIMLVIEEGSEYCPLSTKGKLVPPWIYDRMTGRVVKLATQGRALGVIMVIISQRPAQLNYTVRMMCNLSLYGKFHPKDLADIEEVLSAYKDVPAKTLARECVNMPHGSWIIITSEKPPEIITINAKRKSSHGADTPKVAFAPQTEETKKTFEGLNQILTEALQHEMAEESELEKSKGRIKSLEKDLATAEEETKKWKQSAETLGKIKIEAPTQKVEDVTYIDKVRSDTIAECNRELKTVLLDIRNRFVEVMNEYIEPTPLTTSRLNKADLWETWKDKMPNDSTAKVFKFLIDHEGAKFTRTEICSKVGYTTRSTTVPTALLWLKRNSLITREGDYYFV